MVQEHRVDLKVIPGGAPGGSAPGPKESTWARSGFLGAEPSRNVVGPNEVGLRPVDVVAILYLTVTACLMLAFNANLKSWGALTLGHAVLIVMFLRVGVTGPPKNKILKLFRDLYVLPGMAIFYWELSLLTKLSGAGPHDVGIVQFEQILFGAQWSQTLHQIWPSWILSQYLHFAYFAYYLIPLSLIITLSLQKRWDALQESLTTLALVFFSCCLIFIAYPVTGPYHFYGPPEISAMGGGIAAIAHGVVQSGSSVGTAFPSSHTAVAVAVWFSAFRLSRPVFLVLILIVPALTLGTVYGGFHYVIDTLGGVVWGVLCGLVGPRLNSFLANRLPRPRTGEKGAKLKSLHKSWGET